MAMAMAMATATPKKKTPVLLRFGIVLPALLGAAWALLCNRLLPPLPPPSDPIVRTASAAFRSRIRSHGHGHGTVSPLQFPLEVTSTGALRHDATTVFWNRFADRFGSNPSTPYMYNTLPLFPILFPLPSPMWSLRDPRDAVVLVARAPPRCDYVGLTTFALWVADGRFRRWYWPWSWSWPWIPFASLGDSLNNYRGLSGASSSSYIGESTTAAGNGNDNDNGNGLFAHVVTANSKTACLLTEILAESGIPRSAIHVVPIPILTAAASGWNVSLPLGSIVTGGTLFEVVMRLFRFENQTLGDEYLSSFPPVFYVKGHHDGNHDGNHDGSDCYNDNDNGQPPLPIPRYRDRLHPDTLNETERFGESFANYGSDVLATAGRALRREFAATTTTTVRFRPLKIRGLECLRDRTNCLGDSPDAAYFAPNIAKDKERDDIPLLRLPEHEVHLVTLVDHRAVNTSVYGSVAILTPPNQKQHSLSRSRMVVRATRLGVTSLDFAENERKRRRNDIVSNNGNDSDNDNDNDHRSPVFVSWAFTRNPVHCHRLLAASAASATATATATASKDRDGNPAVVDGCTVVEASDVPLGGYLTYCERVYLNPVTGLGPDWNAILPARLYVLNLEYSPFVPSSLWAKQLLQQQLSQQKLSSPSVWFSKMKFPKQIPFPVYDNDEPFRLLHIVKTGGESLENYLGTVAAPRLTFETCRAAALQFVGNDRGSSPACFVGASLVSAALCGLNCECCASDIRRPGGGGFHGTLIRSPRAHALSLFAHGHAAHHTSWRRIASDFPLYLAEGLLRSTEHACGSYTTGSSPDWKEALQRRLAGSDPPAEVETGRPLRVLPLENTQSHALVCRKSRGSLGQHFRISGVNDLEPDLDDALANLRAMEWVGVTDLMEPSLCLLHYQANGTLPKVCDCNDPQRWAAGYRPLGYWKEHRYQSRSLGSLTPEILSQLDDHTRIDRAVFAEAVRLLLGRLKHIEDVTGASILSCIDWGKFQKDTHYIPELWDEGGVLCCAASN